MLRVKLVEEVPARGALPVWRRDEQAGALALIITDRGCRRSGRLRRHQG